MKAIFLGLWVAACATEVTAIESEEPCRDGAFQPDGTPVVLGDACYDEWARGVAEIRRDLIAGIEDLLPHCIAIAEARGMADTWSALATPLEKAAAACASLDPLELPPGSTCELEAEDPCVVTSFSCTTDTAPPWLDALEAGMPSLVASCCTMSERLPELAEVFGSLVACESLVAEALECATKSNAEVEQLVALFGRVCMVVSTVTSPLG